MDTNQKKKTKQLPNDKITRKEWLQKTGKYTLFTAASMMIILNSSAQDIPPPGTNDGGFGI